MDYGRVEDLSGIDFQLPADDPGNGPFLSAISANSRPTLPARLYCGPPIWNHPGFVGKVYPPRSKKGDFLRHFSRAFNSIELNPTYYGVDVNRLRRWSEQAAPGFVFAPKTPKEISHDRLLADCELLMADFCVAVRDLGDHLGPLFTVLHPRFSPRQLPRLRSFLESLPDDLSMAIELRHPQWFSDPSAWQEATALLREHKAILAVTDSAGRRDAVAQTLCAGATMIRFLGNNLHQSDFDRMHAWVERLSDWIKLGLEEIYFYVHQPSEPLAVELIELLIAELSKRFDASRLLLPPAPPRYDASDSAASSAESDSPGLF